MKKKIDLSIFRNSWLILAIIVLVLLFTAINWYFYSRVRNALNAEFGIRLQSLASLVSSTVSPHSEDLLFMEISPVSIPAEAMTMLRSIGDDFSLSNILVLREDGLILVSLNPDLFPVGDFYPLWNMDHPEIIRALNGKPSATDLYASPDGNYMKAGYAPIPPGNHSAQLVSAVEANASFLQGMQKLRNILLASTALSLTGLALFVWFIFRAAGSLIRARESLLHSETLASMGRMAAGIAHEIRNPLFIIRSSAEKLEAAHPEDAPEIDDLILEEVDRLDGILTDYLLFARNEKLSRQETDIVMIIRRTVKLIEDAGTGTGISINTTFDLPECPFTGEEKKLQQAFINILLNARQAVEGAGTIDVSLTVAGGRYRIAFSDSGVGIPPKEIEKVFEPFYTTKPAGSGLGLAIAKKIIEDHGGTIDIASRPGRGTVVSVYLPAPVHTAGDENE